MERVRLLPLLLAGQELLELLTGRGLLLGREVVPSRQGEVALVGFREPVLVHHDKAVILVARLGVVFPVAIQVAVLPVGRLIEG